MAQMGKRWVRGAGPMGRPTPSRIKAAAAAAAKFHGGTTDKKPEPPAPVIPKKKAPQPKPKIEITREDESGLIPPQMLNNALMGKKPQPTYYQSRAK